MILLYQSSDHHLLDEELRKHLYLVTKVVNQLAYKRTVDFDKDDFISVGMLGLYEALQTYNTSSKLSFEHYAQRKIRWKIVDEIRRTNNIPALKAKQVINFLKKQEELGQVLLRTPSDDEIAKALSMSAKELAQTKEAINYFLVYSLDQLVDEDDENSMTFYDIHHHQNVHQESALKKIIHEENREFLYYAISHLEKREQLLIQLHFVEGFNFVQISEVLNLSPSRVSQLYRKTLKSLEVFYAYFKRCEERQ